MSVATFTVSRKSLLARLKAVSANCPRRSPTPVVQTVELAVNGVVSIRSNDRDGEITMVDSDCGRTGELKGLVYPGPLTKFLTSTKAAVVTCELTDKTLTVKDGSSSVEFPVETFGHYSGTEPGEWQTIDLPEFKPEQVIARFNVTAELLATAIGQTVYACDEEYMRYALGGVHFDLSADSVRLVATDTRRLSFYPIGGLQVWQDDDVPDIRKCHRVVPSKFLQNVAKILRDWPEELVTVEFSETRVTIRGNSFVCSSRLIEGHFPPYRDVIPTSFDRKVTLPHAEFLAAVKIAHAQRNDERRGTDFRFAEFDCRLSIGTASAQCAAESSCVAKYPGKSEKIRLDTLYILDFLTALPKKTKAVVMRLNDAGKPVELTADSIDTLYLQMPLCID